MRHRAARQLACELARPHLWRARAAKLVEGTPGPGASCFMPAGTRATLNHPADTLTMTATPAAPSSGVTVSDLSEARRQLAHDPLHLRTPRNPWDASQLAPPEIQLSSHTLQLSSQSSPALRSSRIVSTQFSSDNAIAHAHRLTTNPSTPYQNPRPSLHHRSTAGVPGAGPRRPPPLPPPHNAGLEAPPLPGGRNPNPKASPRPTPTLHDRDILRELSAPAPSPAPASAPARRDSGVGRGGSAGSGSRQEGSDPGEVGGWMPRASARWWPYRFRYTQFVVGCAWAVPECACKHTTGTVLCLFCACARWWPYRFRYTLFVVGCAWAVPVLCLCVLILRLSCA